MKNLIKDSKELWELIAYVTMELNFGEFGDEITDEYLLCLCNDFYKNKELKPNKDIIKKAVSAIKGMANEL